LALFNSCHLSLYPLLHWTPHPLPQYLALYLSAFACAQFFIIFCLPISFPSLTSSQRAIHDRNSAPTPRSLHGLKAIFTQLLRAASHDEEAQATTTPRPRTAGNQLSAADEASQGTGSGRTCSLRLFSGLPNTNLEHRTHGNPYLNPRKAYMHRL